MGSVLPTGKYDTTPYLSTDNAEHTIFTVNGYDSVLITHIWAADDGGVARTITLIARISSVDYPLVFNAPIIANAPYDLEFMPLVLKTNDTIKATVDAAGVAILVSYAAQARRT